MQSRRFRRSRRLVVAAGLLIALAAATVAAASIASSRDAMDDCTATPPGRVGSDPGMIVAVDWEWLPPGYVCVFQDRNGRELDRRRP
jgi:hypothetical protein